MWSEELRTAGPLGSTGVTPLPRYRRPIWHPLVVSRFPGVSGYAAYPASALSSRDEEGFSSCAVDFRPRAVANHPAGAARRVNQFAAECSLHPTGAGSASGATHFRGRLAFTLVTAQELDLTLLARSSRGLPSKLRGLRFLPRQVCLLHHPHGLLQRSGVRESKRRNLIHASEWWLLTAWSATASHGLPTSQQ